MDKNLTVSSVHPPGERSASLPACVEESLWVDSFAGKIEVRWAPDEAVTALGQLSFFVDFLKQADLFEPFVERAPLAYASPNAPQARDVLGTLVLAILGGAKRYAHVNWLRHDGVNPDLLGMSRVCSDDSVRAAIKRMDEEAAEAWLRSSLDYVVRPLLREPWILDIDTTVKPVYGRQQGAVVGYNPLKRGRPSQVIHSYEMSTTRLMIDCEVEAGNRSHSKYGLPGLEALLDGLRPEERPTLVRGDRGYGTERVMSALEARDQEYLFKLPMRSRVKALVQKMASRQGWVSAGQGWEAAAAELRLDGWARKRKVLVLRRRVGDRKPSLPRPDPDQLQLAFTEIVVSNRDRYEYAVLVTSMTAEPLTIAQLYRDRADSENAFDELKNQWGWGGFVTRDFKRTRIMVRLNAVVYNWWSLFVRMLDPECRREAKTSRPLMMQGVARATRHGRQTTLLLTVAHSASGGLRAAFAQTCRFLRDVQNAPQLTAHERWCRILGYAMRKYLHGQAPRPPPGALPA